MRCPSLVAISPARPRRPRCSSSAASAWAMPSAPPSSAMPAGRVAALSAQPGCLAASIGQSTDESGLIAIRTEWVGRRRLPPRPVGLRRQGQRDPAAVGGHRRAVRLRAGPSLDSRGPHRRPQRPGRRRRCRGARPGGRPVRAAGHVMSDFANLADAGRRLGPASGEALAGTPDPLLLAVHPQRRARRPRASARRSTLPVRGAARGALGGRRRHPRRPDPGRPQRRRRRRRRGDRDGRARRGRALAESGVASVDARRARLLRRVDGLAAAPLRPDRGASCARWCTGACPGTSTTSTRSTRRPPWRLLADLPGE